MLCSVEEVIKDIRDGRRVTRLSEISVDKVHKPTLPTGGTA